MDGGQFRMPQRTSRGTVSRPEPVRRPAEDAQPKNEEPKAASRPVSSQRARREEEEKKSSNWFKWPLIVLLIVALGAAGWFGWSNMRGAASAIDGSKYQAVFLTNGQFYFGKLHTLDGGYLRLTDVYYIQDQSNGGASTDKAAAQASTSDNNYKLIKLGDEIHGPEDAMVIPSTQVLYYENLKTDGKVSQLIKQDSK